MWWGRNVVGFSQNRGKQLQTVFLIKKQMHDMFFAILRETHHIYDPTTLLAALGIDLNLKDFLFFYRDVSGRPSFFFAFFYRWSLFIVVYYIFFEN
jgi:hypothetical protein